jgi:hypothetical protein
MVLSTTSEVCQCTTNNNNSTGTDAKRILTKIDPPTRKAIQIFLLADICRQPFRVAGWPTTRKNPKAVASCPLFVSFVFRVVTMLRIAAIVLATLSVVAAYEVPSLTPENYDKLTAGKTVFIKFFAPWVGDCICATE